MRSSMHDCRSLLMASHQHSRFGAWFLSGDPSPMRMHTRAGEPVSHYALQARLPAHLTRHHLQRTLDLPYT